MLTELPREHRPRLSPLFQGQSDTLIRSCLQGHMGRAWVNDGQAPSCALLAVCDFCYVAGDPDAPGANELLRLLSPAGRKRDLFVIPPNERWSERLRAVYPNAVPITRYAIRHEGDVFDRARLQRFAADLPHGYRIRKIDEALYDMLLRHEELRDLCANFDSANDYLARARGYVAVCDGTPVSGASAYAVYDHGLEIEVDTHPEHRRKGLALACSAALMLDCLEAGIYPSWDAANLASVRLSERLGYRFDREYTAYCLPAGEAARDFSPVYEPRVEPNRVSAPEPM